MKRITILSLSLALSACAGSTQPEDVKLATEQCAEHGGWATVARFEHGKNLLIGCSDGTQIDVRRERP